MIFNMNGGSGSVKLNFKVVGGTSAPSNPKENTIWVNTDIPITGWMFDTENTVENSTGKVWFSTNTFSATEFNALKNNSIQVYPTSAKQYIDGGWVDKPAKIYIDGEWKDLLVYIYHLGWVAGSGFYHASGNGAPKITAGIDSNGYMTLSRPTTWNSYAWCVTNETFDLTNVSTIYCETKDIGSTVESPIRFGINQKSGSKPATQVSLSKANTVYTLDVSSVRGKYNIGFFGYNSSSLDSDWRWYAGTKIKAIWYK